MFDVPDHAQYWSWVTSSRQGAVHPQHDDARAQRGDLPQPDDVDAGAGPGAVRAVVRGAVPVVAGRRGGGDGPGAGGRGDAAVADGGAGARRVLDRAGRRRPRAGCSSPRSTPSAWPMRPSRTRSTSSSPTPGSDCSAYPYLPLAQGFMLHRAGRRLPRAHRAERRGPGRRARSAPSAWRCCTPTTWWSSTPWSARSGSSSWCGARAHPLALLVGDRGDPRLLGAAGRLLPVPDLVRSVVAVDPEPVRERRGLDADAAAAGDAARRAAGAGGDPAARVWPGSTPARGSPRAGRSSAWPSSTCRRCSR